MPGEEELAILQGIEGQLSLFATSKLVFLGGTWEFSRIGAVVL